MVQQLGGPKAAMTAVKQLLPGSGSEYKGTGLVPANKILQRNKGKRKKPPKRSHAPPALPSAPLPAMQVAAIGGQDKKSGSPLRKAGRLARESGRFAREFLTNLKKNVVVKRS